MRGKFALFGRADILHALVVEGDWRHQPSTTQGAFEVPFTWTAALKPFPVPRDCGVRPGRRPCQTR